MRRIAIAVLAYSCLIGFARAQQTSLSGPIEGFTFDAPTGSFRAVIGLPGSASLGPAILSGFGSGSVAPQKDYGLAFSEDQALFVSGLHSTSPSTSPLSSAMAGQEGVVWSADGSLAVLFSRS